MTKNQKKILFTIILPAIIILLAILIEKENRSNTKNHDQQYSKNVQKNDKIKNITKEQQQITIPIKNNINNKKAKPHNAIANNNVNTIYQNDDWEGEKYPEFRQHKITTGKKFMVATLDHRASAAGAKMLEIGGNAIDAAIAAQMVLNVVEPQSSGIGGGAFLLYYDKKNNKSTYYNGRETAPKASNDKIFIKKDGSVMSFEEAVNGGLSVGTPGLLKILVETHKKYGRLEWEALFNPAIKIADEGFPMEDKIRTILKDVKYLKNNPDLKKLYFNQDGEIKKNGEIIYNKDLAKTLSLIANSGINSFYKGRIAKNIVEKVQTSENPGYLSLYDLQNYRSRKGDLLCSFYRSYKVCSMLPPSSGGVTLLQILSILEKFNLQFLSPKSAKTIHLIAEASKLAYQDRNKYIADIKNVPLKELLNKRYLRQRGGLIKADQIIKNPKAGNFKLSSNYHINQNDFEANSTTHISIIDPEGNAVSMTSSIEYLFGSNLMVNGFMLNNQMTDFSLQPTINGKKVINRVIANKQPRSSMSPTFVFDNQDNLILILGSPGGPRIIQYVLKTIIAHLDWKMNIKEAIDLPNFIAIKDVLELEKNSYLEEMADELKQIGHNVKIKNLSSGITAISIEDGVIYGAADHRRNGLAVGQ